MLTGKAERGNGRMEGRKKWASDLLTFEIVNIPSSLIFYIPPHYVIHLLAYKIVSLVLMIT